MKKVANTVVTINGKKVTLNKKDYLIVLSALLKAGYKQDELLAKKGNGIDIFYGDEYRTVYSSAPRVAEIKLNGNKASLLSRIKKDDVIEVNEPNFDSNRQIHLSDIPGYKCTINFNIDGVDVPVMRMVEVNDVVSFGDCDIKNGDKVIPCDYYTVRQLREMLDLDEDVVVLRDGEELQLEDWLFEDDEIENYVKIVYDRFVNSTEQPVAELLTGDDFDDFIYTTSDDSEDGNVVRLGHEVHNKVDEVEEINVILNGEEINLNNKSYYAVIDVLDAQNFDTSLLIGKNFSIKVNEQKASFATQICNNDVVEFTYDE